MIARCNRFGFSIIDVMVVVAIVGVASARATPNIVASIRRANEPAQLLRVQGFAADARNYARRTNQCVVVARAADGASLSAIPVALCASSARCRCRASVLSPETLTLNLNTKKPAVTVTRFIANTGVEAAFTANATGEQILFLPDGTTPYSATAQIEVRLPEHGLRLINILPASGFVRAQR